MALKDSEIKKILVEQLYLKKEDIKKVDDFLDDLNTPMSFTDALYAQGLMSKDLLGQALAEHYGVAYSDLNSYIPERDQVLLIPEEVARKFRVVLFKSGEKEVSVATDNPKKPGIKVALKEVFGRKKVNLTFSLSEDIDEIFVFYNKPLETRFQSILESEEAFAPQIIEEILKDALAYKASDIHFEPQRKDVVVRFRVDGMLQNAGHLESGTYENIINRIKVQASMRIDEHYKIQDGAIRYEVDENIVDLRVSITPTINGEKVVIRVLAAYVKGFSLDDVGLNEAQKEIALNTVKKPVGMMIIAGPTGSGKTTSLYSFLKLVNKPTTNITTIEDPVEYRVSGLNQIQVDPENGVTFTAGLRSIVRQDPDIILVGEIRDEETAGLAVNAALTGHLVLSTFHANDAATVVPRLIDMGVEPFLLSSTLELIVSQRLVRKVCDHCKHSDVISEADLKKMGTGVHASLKKDLDKKGNITLYKGSGCSVCNHTGYKGRTSIFEMIPVTQKIQELIVKNPTSDELWALAAKEGAMSMYESGLENVKNGETSLEELLRVVPPKNN